MPMVVRSMPVPEPMKLPGARRTILIKRLSKKHMLLGGGENWAVYVSIPIIRVRNQFKATDGGACDAAIVLAVRSALAMGAVQRSSPAPMPTKIPKNFAESWIAQGANIGHTLSMTARMTSFL